MENRISAVLHSPIDSTPEEELKLPRQSGVNRRSFLRNTVVAGAAVTMAAGLGDGIPSALAQQTQSGSITSGDAAILSFLAAAEIIESDLWLQYAELGGFQGNELPTLASQQIPGYPATPTGGNTNYTKALSQLDGDMPQYIHDNTEDELTHETFINAYLVSKGASPVNLDPFRTLPSSKATGANQIGRLTNLMQLTVDTTWWTRYRSRTKNPDFGDTFPPAIASLATGQHTAIPRTDNDTKFAKFVQVIANTAGFHFAFIEQAGTSIYPKLAQRVTSKEVLRILLSIGGTEICHFQTWHDKAGNAPVLSNVVDPVTGVSVTFPNLNASPFGGEDFQTNLIMPEPCPFLQQSLPVCSIIRPTGTQGAAMAALQGFVSDGLFIGQSNEFLQLMTELAQAADAAVPGC